MVDLDGRISGISFSAARNRLRFAATPGLPIIGILCDACSMIVIGTEVVENYLADHAGHKGTKAARSQYEACSTLWAATSGVTPRT